MRHPIVNLNGDDWQTLYDNAIAAELALNSAREALCSIRPHGRNYQTNPPEDFAEAYASWCVMIIGIDKLIKEAQKLRIELFRQRRK